MIYQRVQRPSSTVAQGLPADPVRQTRSTSVSLAVAPYVPAMHALARIAVGPAERPASGATVQLKTYKDSQIRAMVKEAAKTAQPNRVALLLAVYNQMRYELPVAPAAFTTVLAAETALITGNRIDADDAAALDAEATRLQQAGGDPAEATRLRIVGAIAAGRNAVEASYAQHIFQGDTKNGVPTGFHSTVDGSATHEEYGTATNVGNASSGGNQAYQQSVRLQANHATTKPIQSTFFPAAASHGQVIDAIASVYKAGLTTVGHVAATVNGLKLAKRGDTVFPAGGSDDRVAE
jgi:hypothetical protein